MNIKTEYQATRVWVAYDDNTYDGPGSIIGWGETKDEAIADLLERTAEKAEIADFLKRGKSEEFGIKDFSVRHPFPNLAAEHSWFNPATQRFERMPEGAPDVRGKSWEDMTAREMEGKTK